MELLRLALWILWMGLPTAFGDGEESQIEPDFIEEIGNVTVAQGRDAFLSCSIAHLNDYTVGWVKVDTKAIQATGRRVVTLNTRVSVENIPGSPTWKLIIKNAQPDDAGFYMAQINTNPMKSKMAYLTVMKPPNIDDEATPSVRQVRENESVVLHCQATGQPVPNITWRREDGSNISHDSCRQHTNDIQPLEEAATRGFGRLCIGSANRSSMGSYFCIASNGIPPSVSKRIQLVVLFATHVRSEKPLVGAPAGAQAVSLDCIVEASPQPNHFLWYKGNHSVGDDIARYHTSVQRINSYTIKMTLVIQEVKEDDAGLYRCQAAKVESTVRFYVTLPTRKTTTTPTSTTMTLITTEPTTVKKQPAVTRTTTESYTTTEPTATHYYQASAGVLTDSHRPAHQAVDKTRSIQRSSSSRLRHDLVYVLSMTVVWLMNHV